MQKQTINLSNTSMRAFLDCKQKFKYNYIDKVYTDKSPSNKYLSFGTSIHATLAQFNKITDIKHRTLDHLTTLYKKNWVRDGYDSIEEERVFDLRGIDMLTNYFNNPLDTSKQNYLIEKMIKYPINDQFTLCGKIDKLFVNSNNQIELLDYKTGKNISPIDTLQNAIYLLLSRHILGRYPDMVSFYHLSHNKKISQKITNSIVEESIEIVSDLYEQVSKETHFPNNKDIYCKENCAHYTTCTKVDTCKLH
ncbi:PD-(D/E)XK nuclease family protein [Lutibacter sp. B2]|nr:PD-(D/E)XK nuclease family protein [Lutibacter sp. B2]